MSSAICLNLDQSKILSSGNGLTVVLQKQPWIYLVEHVDKDQPTHTTMQSDPV